MDRLLHRGKFLDEIRRQVINALHERDTAIQKATSLEREVRLLRQDMIELGEDLYSSSCGPNSEHRIRRVAAGLIQVGRDGSEHREHRQRRKLRLIPYPQRRIYNVTLREDI